MLYLGLRHFRYAGEKIEPGRVFEKLAVRNNDFLEKKSYVERFDGREDDLIPCPECPAKFANHIDMQRHVDRTVHRDGKIIHSDEGIRAKEQEEAIEEQMARNPEKPGYVEAAAGGGEAKESKTRKGKKTRA